LYTGAIGDAQEAGGLDGSRRAISGDYREATVLERAGWLVQASAMFVLLIIASPPVLRRFGRFAMFF